jgi:hydroxyquinol 1,2-dioxygenase
VFGVKDSLIADFVKVDDANQAAAVGLPSPFWSVKWDFVLARTDQVGRSRA